ncbi:predicted protein [Nematostella vectensis]|uniref:receptor protein serine/threonine kinase n=1 Tax=Nematostella vectensis TaxID=45351 RepID=A7RR38_NEMVE|nr:bone morphogenetic protein receptor type II-like protein [Nematostella vectensis]EDO46101.1 predicted protein [Nematostella vectensis]|eukprot:XP_001638164.1 predicted protein [Nematostella vectensis]
MVSIEAYAHRDLCSSNILVKRDGTCAITDFQFTKKLSTRDLNKVEQIETAGTMRYWSPELLDQAISFEFFCESLCQADVYSLSLIVWEIVMRCRDIYPDSIEEQDKDDLGKCLENRELEGTVPHYRQAYEDELGKNTTRAELDKHVRVLGLRPEFPRIFRQQNPCHHRDTLHLTSPSVITTLHLTSPSVITDTLHLTSPCVITGIHYTLQQLVSSQGYTTPYSTLCHHRDTLHLTSPCVITGYTTPYITLCNHRIHYTLHHLVSSQNTPHLTSPSVITGIHYTLQQLVSSQGYTTPYIA